MNLQSGLLTEEPTMRNPPRGWLFNGETKWNLRMPPTVRSRRDKIKLLIQQREAPHEPKHTPWNLEVWPLLGSPHGTGTGWRDILTKIIYGGSGIHVLIMLDVDHNDNVEISPCVVSVAVALCPHDICKGPLQLSKYMGESGTTLVEWREGRRVNRIFECLSVYKLAQITRRKL